MKKITLTILVATLAAFYSSSAFAENNTLLGKSIHLSCYNDQVILSVESLDENGNKKVTVSYRSGAGVRAYSIKHCYLRENEQILLCKWNNGRSGIKHRLELDLNGDVPIGDGSKIYTTKAKYSESSGEAQDVHCYYTK